MTTIFLLIRYGGKWISTSENRMSYFGGSTESCLVDDSITYAGLQQEIAKTIGLNLAKFNINLACQYGRSDISPLQIRSDQNVETLFVFISRIFPEQEPICVTAVPRSSVHPSCINVVSPVQSVTSPQIVSDVNFCPVDKVIQPCHSSVESNLQINSMGPMFCIENRQSEIDPDYDYSAVFGHDIDDSLISAGSNDIGNEAVDDNDNDTSDHSYDKNQYTEQDCGTEQDYGICQQNQEADCMYEDTYIQPSTTFLHDHHTMVGHSKHHDDIEDDMSPRPLRQRRPYLDFNHTRKLPDDNHSSYDAIGLTIGGVSVGQIFDSKMQLQDTLALHAIKHKYQYITSRSTKYRWEVRCSYISCKWRCRAIKVEDSNFFVVRKINAVHTCPRDQVYLKHRQATARVVGMLQKPKFTDVNRVHRPINIVQDILEEFNINLSYAKAWRAKEFALTSLMGSIGYQSRSSTTRQPQEDLVQESKQQEVNAKCG